MSETREDLLEQADALDARAAEMYESDPDADTTYLRLRAQHLRYIAAYRPLRDDSI